MSELSLKVRKASLDDSASLLQMMRQLAEFEGYLDNFLVTAEELEARLFHKNDFDVFVAETNNTVSGMLVYYHLPFTYDLTPWVYIKELFVKPEFRQMSVGKELMKSLAQECKDIGCKKIRWDILTSNISAKKFYKSLGAKHEMDWSFFSITEDSISQLANTITH
ncbi:GNAT family N-acetyltransferase [uncultured Microbulbifer sp.]|uniref:GNAT family N-acetyltransferase n=1 Tax=uncultured Microbulbifer sp. TaxID=348147 RepID=UPI002626C602|nr:GNAT family N-acetyltransferase [uncultured Microbulbifer sp.]